MSSNLEDIAQEMLVQNNRGTSWPIFIVVEDQKVYGVDSDFTDCERERKDMDAINEDKDLCATCRAAYDETGYLPEECDDSDCEDSFILYRIQKYVPNMRAGFFFTAKACDEHIKEQAHHYDKSAVSYCISAYNNEELRRVMVSLVGVVNIAKIT